MLGRQPLTGFRRFRLRDFLTGEYIIFFALTFWFVGMLVPYWEYSDWEGRREVLEENLTLPYQIGGSILFMMTFIAFGSRYIVRYFKAIRYSPHIVLFFIYFAFVLLCFPLSVAPLMSAAYTLYSFLLFIALGAIWMIDRAVVLRGLRILLVVFLVYLVAYVLKNIDGLLFGAIQKNQFAKSWQAALVLAVLVLDRGRLIITLFIVAFIAYLSSRSSLITSMILLMGLAGQLVLEKKLQQVRLWLMAGLLMVLATMPFFGSIGDALYSHVLALDDETRGIEAGLFTGRQYLWGPGFELLVERPFIGYGFRTRGDLFESPGPRYNAHMGYLNLVLDSGIVGGSLFLYGIAACLVTRGLQHYRNALLRRRKIFRYENYQDRLNYLIFLFILTYLGILFSEPIYFNLGTPFSLLVMMMLAAPLGTAPQTRPMS